MGPELQATVSICVIVVKCLSFHLIQCNNFFKNRVMWTGGQKEAKKKKKDAS